MPIKSKLTFNGRARFSAPRVNLWQELWAYGPYLALVTGPFGNFSSDETSKLLLISLRASGPCRPWRSAKNINPALALAVHRRALVRRIGLLTSRGWAQHVVDRWRDAVSNRPTVPHHVTDIDLAADEFLSDNPHRCGYHGMHVPGA